MASEIVKQQLNAGRAKELYFFRDQQGLEVDFIVPRGNARLALVECKASRTATVDDGAPIAALRRAVSRYQTQGFVAYQPLPSAEATSVLRPGVRAVSLMGLLNALSSPAR